MRHTQFWDRMDQVLGPDYSRSWAELTVLSDLGGRTVREALASGMTPKEVWAAVRRQLELSDEWR
ncbi:MAG: DUF3046 domain-containing protein [Nocardioides sp.]|nr:DUF3046 domain-containing protein [Nocardioides sp.]